MCDTTSCLAANTLGPAECTVISVVASARLRHHLRRQRHVQEGSVFIGGCRGRFACGKVCFFV